MRVLGKARFCFLIFLMNLIASSGGAKPTEAAASLFPSAETVVLLHGIGLRSWSLWRIEMHLRCEGYRVVNLTYPSRRLPLEELGRSWLPAELKRRGVDEQERLSFVTHSMGGIVVRAWLRETGVPANLGRVVMLAPPNHGSIAADRTSQSRAFRWFMGPNLDRLGTGANSLPLELGAWPAKKSPLGIVAGDRTINPLFSSWLKEPNDGAVTIRSAQLEGMSDFLVLHHSHTVLAWRADTIAAVKTFLRTRAFSTNAGP
jgi:triacylglycerol lipase